MSLSRRGRPSKQTGLTLIWPVHCLFYFSIPTAPGNKRSQWRMVGCWGVEVLFGNRSDVCEGVYVLISSAIRLVDLSRRFLVMTFGVLCAVYKICDCFLNLQYARPAVSGSESALARSIGRCMTAFRLRDLVFWKIQKKQGISFDYGHYLQSCFLLKQVHTRAAARGTANPFPFNQGYIYTITHHSSTNSSTEQRAQRPGSVEASTLRWQAQSH